jgi:pseudoazurin
MGRRDRNAGGLGAAWLVVTCLFIMESAAPADLFEVVGVDNRRYEFMFFEPDFLRIEPGDSVTFVVSDFDHLPRSVHVPEGAEPWEAESGQSITVRFEQEGIYVFECDYHAVMGMAGVLLVGEPVNFEAAHRFYEDYRAKRFAMNADRLDRLWAPGGPLRPGDMPRERPETENR